MRVLGIETSCDETGLAIYDANEGLIAHTIYSQTDIHRAFGGVVPELASRDHLRKILPLFHDILNQTHLNEKDIQGIAYTKGPGLVGALLVGAMFGRALGYVLSIPTLGVHHLEGHILAPFLEENPPSFPFLALLVSGGHTALIDVSAFSHYKIIGDTLDDAVGEAFDKTAKLLGLPYPGGALLSALAEKGKANRFQFPRPMTDRSGLDFSFSGLKTYALQTIRSHELNDQTKADIAKAFEEAVVETMVIKCKRALIQTGYQSLVISGGVGANKPLRRALQKLCDERGVKLVYPEPIFCTDNGAMIAYVGCQRLMRGEREPLTVDVLPRWSLESLS